MAELADEVFLPIVPEKIAKFIKREGVIEDVIFIGVDINTEILRGKFVRLVYDQGAPGFLPPPYALPDSGLMIKVYYDRTQPKDYQRVVVNKELLHAIDPSIVKISTPQKVIDLANHIRLPIEVITSSIDGNNAGALVDYMADFRAIVAMVPENIRIHVCQRYAEEKISREQIADLFGIPLRYVGVVLSDVWPNMRNVWLNLPI